MTFALFTSLGEHFLSGLLARFAQCQTAFLYKHGRFLYFPFLAPILPSSSSIPFFALPNSRSRSIKTQSSSFSSPVHLLIHLAVSSSYFPFSPSRCAPLQFFPSQHNRPYRSFLGRVFGRRTALHPSHLFTALFFLLFELFSLSLSPPRPHQRPI